MKFRQNNKWLYLFIALGWFLLPGQGWAFTTSVGDSLVSSDKIIAGTFANDATFRTDYYFTQGVSVNLVHPALSKSPVNKILLSPGRFTTSHYGIKIVYDCFTPLKIHDPELRRGDHPYAAYIYTRHYRVLNNPGKRQRLTSGLDLGFMGPGAGARQFQTKMHQWLDSPRPEGWKYQVQTDLVLGYQATIEKQLSPTFKPVELIGSTSASLGSLYTFAAGELLLRTGKMNPYFQNLGISSRENRGNLQKFQFYAQARLIGKLVGYNATLQGGLFNHHNPYTLAASQINRGITQQTAGLVCSYGGVSFESSVVWISPQFKNALHHKWMHFDLRIAL